MDRPLLRYFGGKFALAPWIIEHMPPHRIYVEPFGGGGSVLLCKPRSYAEVYNDLDKEIVNVFRTFRDDFEKLANRLRNTPFSRVEYDQAYEPTECLIESAARTVIRSWMGFGNSTQRANGKTGFQSMTEITGSSKANQWKTYLEYLDHFKKRLHGVVIECRDASQIIEQQDTKETLFFVDPPYILDTRKSGNYKYELSLDQHKALCDRLSQVNGMVMLCGYSHELYDSLGWHRIDRRVNSMASVDPERWQVLTLNALSVCGLILPPKRGLRKRVYFKKKFGGCFRTCLSRPPLL